MVFQRQGYLLILGNWFTITALPNKVVQKLSLYFHYSDCMTVPRKIKSKC